MSIDRLRKSENPLFEEPDPRGLRGSRTDAQIASYIHVNQPHSNANHCCQDNLMNIFRLLSLQDMARCRLVSIEWNKLILIIWTPRIKDNISLSNNTLALIRNLDARIQAFIVMAKAAASYDIQEAKDIFTKAKKEAAQSPPMLASIVKAEASIDRVGARLNLQHLKKMMRAPNVDRLDYAYYLVKCAQLEKSGEEQGALADVQEALNYLWLIKEQEEAELSSLDPEDQISRWFDLAHLTAQFDICEAQQIFAKLQTAYTLLPFAEMETRETSDFDMSMFLSVIIPALLEDGDSEDMSPEEAEKADFFTRQYLSQVLPNDLMVEDLIQSLHAFKRSLCIISFYMTFKEHPAHDMLLLMKSCKKKWLEEGADVGKLSQLKTDSLQSVTFDNILMLLAIARIEAGFNLEAAQETLAEIHKLLMLSDSNSPEFGKLLPLMLIKQILRT